jgi:hypothetical protein
LVQPALKGSKSLKIIKINMAFRFDKLSHLSKSVHIEENSQILTVSNKKKITLNHALLKLSHMNDEIVKCIYNLSI